MPQRLKLPERTILDLGSAAGPAPHPSTLTARTNLAYWTGQADSQARH